MGIYGLLQNSLEIELNRQTTANAVAIGISYIVMFLYVTIALGRFTIWKRFVIDSRAILALGGITIVGISLLISFAFFNALRLKTTLIIAEVRE